jgi:hypothetical protein
MMKETNEKLVSDCSENERNKVDVVHLVSFKLVKKSSFWRSS